MIVRFFNTGTSNGESPVHYLLQLRDSNGDVRSEVPELLAGSPHLTIDLINSIARKHKYSSGCLAFRPEEQPTRAQLFGIIDRFKEVVAPGLSEDQFNSLFVIHREPPDRKTGLSGFHVHFVLPMTLLAGKTASGRSMVGKRWNPHPPGRRTIDTMALFTKVINHEHGWAQVTENPLRMGMDSFWRKADKANHQHKAALLRKELSRSIGTGEIKSRAELLQYLDQTLGLTITRATDTTVSVRFPGTAKAIRLKGAMYETQTDFQALGATKSQCAGDTKLSATQYQQAKDGLDQLLSSRAMELLGMAIQPKPHTTTTRKEHVYGRNQKRLGGNKASSQNIGRLSGLPLTASGMGRNLLQKGGERRRDEHGTGYEAGHAGSQTPTQPIQHSGSADQGATGARRQRRSGGSTAASGIGDIDQKIRALALELNDCEIGSMEAHAIMTQLGALQGEREHQPRGPRPKR